MIDWIDVRITRIQKVIAIEDSRKQRIDAALQLVQFTEHPSGTVIENAIGCAGYGLGQHRSGYGGFKSSGPASRVSVGPISSNRWMM